MQSPCRRANLVGLLPLGIDRIPVLIAQGLPQGRGRANRPDRPAVLHLPVTLDLCDLPLFVGILSGAVLVPLEFLLQELPQEGIPQLRHFRSAAEGAPVGHTGRHASGRIPEEIAGQVPLLSIDRSIGFFHSEGFQRLCHGAGIQREAPGAPMDIHHDVLGKIVEYANRLAHIPDRPFQSPKPELVQPGQIRLDCRIHQRLLPGDSRRTPALVQAHIVRNGLLSCLERFRVVIKGLRKQAEVCRKPQTGDDIVISCIFHQCPRKGQSIGLQQGLR